jgi:hypothetical protein
MPVTWFLLLFLFVRVHVLVLFVGVCLKYILWIVVVQCFGVSLFHNTLLIKSKTHLYSSVYVSYQFSLLNFTSYINICQLF